MHNLLHKKKTAWGVITIKDYITHKPLEGVCLSIPEIRQNGITNENGNFLFSGFVKNETYLIEAAYKAYRMDTLVFTPLQNQNAAIYYLMPYIIPFGTTDKNNQENFIVISQKGDTIQYNLTKLKIAQKTTTDKLLKKIPGFLIQKNSSIEVLRKTVGQIYIDGEKTVSQEILKNIPANTVKGIQVYDSENLLKDINIITKEN